MGEATKAGETEAVRVTVEFTESGDDDLRDDPRFEEEEETIEEEQTEVILGTTWIPGSRRPKGTG